MPSGPLRKLGKLQSWWLEIPIQTSSSKSPVGKRQNGYSGMRLWHMWEYLSIPWKFMPGVNPPKKPHTECGSSVTEALTSSRETAGNTWLLCDQDLISYGYHLVLICLCLWMCLCQLQQSWRSPAVGVTLVGLASASGQSERCGVLLTVGNISWSSKLHLWAIQRHHLRQQQGERKFVGARSQQRH